MEREEMMTLNAIKDFASAAWLRHAERARAVIGAALSLKGERGEGF
jgi:hypothetical protein